jgi:hypothetical protein
MLEINHEDIVGRRVHVFWDGDQEWFSGIIASLTSTSQFKVQYEDGDEGLEQLASQSVRIEIAAGEQVRRPTPAQLRSLHKAFRRSKKYASVLPLVRPMGWWCASALQPTPRSAGIIPEHVSCAACDVVSDGAQMQTTSLVSQMLIQSRPQPGLICGSTLSRCRWQRPRTLSAQIALSLRVLL